MVSKSSVFAAVCLLRREGLSGPEVLSVSRKDLPDAKGLPGGKLEDGETSEEAARRELLEEAGVMAGPMREVFYSVDDAGVRVVVFEAETFSEAVQTGEAGVVEWLPPQMLITSSPYPEFNAALFRSVGIRF